MADNKVSEMLSEVTENFRGMIDANSVVGEPIIASDGTMIVPISKVSFGFGGGGSEFDSKNSNDTRFGGGMGGGASVNAEAFLVINNDNVRIVSMGNDNSPVSKLVDLMPGIIDKVNGFIVKRKDKKAAQNEAAETSGEYYDND
ncbi:MAG: sporulation protein YtfJ [Clostridia bacterium]|nr:sporulation protein YtfJ [Clostridia bacterium]